MKAPDLDKERSERKLSLSGFLSTYNEGLPKGFSRASFSFLEAYKKLYPSQFKDGLWSLDLHRKKFMDWLPMHIKSLEPRLRVGGAGAIIGTSTSAEPEK